jgi:hypothetical protein
LTFGKMARMEFEIDFPTGGPADVEMSVSGVPTLAELELFNDALVSDPRFRAGLTILVDVAGLEYAGISPEELQALSEPTVVRDWQYRPAAMAIVAPDAPAYEHVQRYRAHVGGSMSNRRVFSTRAEAVAWLEEEGRAEQESGPG